MLRHAYQLIIFPVDSSQPRLVSTVLYSLLNRLPISKPKVCGKSFIGMDGGMRFMLRKSA